MVVSASRRGMLAMRGEVIIGSEIGSPLAAVPLVHPQSAGRDGCQRSAAASPICQKSASSRDALPKSAASSVKRRSVIALAARSSR